MSKVFLRVAVRPTLIALVMLFCATVPPLAAADGGLQPFLGQPKFEMRKLFEGERFPNVVVASDGTVLATWGSKRVRVRRSEDGGQTWGGETAIGDGIHGGGVIVDERSGDILVFTHPQHPPRDGATAPRNVYRSTDHGKSWQAAEATFHKDAGGFVPSLHMMEHGATLLRGKHAGRLIRARLASIAHRPSATRRRSTATTAGGTGARASRLPNWAPAKRRWSNCMTAV